MNLNYSINFLCMSVILVLIEFAIFGIRKDLEEIKTLLRGNVLKEKEKRSEE